MVTLSRERWWADGWELTDGYYRDVEIRDGLSNSVPMSSQIQEAYVVGRHGVLDGLRRTFDQGSFVLQAWILESRYYYADQDYQLLLRAAGAQHRLAHWQHLLADGTYRECYGRLASAVQPTALGQLGMRVSLEVNIPGAFWQDGSPSTDTGTPGGSGVLPLASKALASAPMTDLQFLITGPITNPTVTCTSDPTINDSFTFAGTIPAGATLLFDSGSWQLTATGMVAPTLDAVTWTGNRLLEVPPAEVALVPTVALTGTAKGAATNLAVTGRAKYQAA